jgi:serine/threonine-protein kinase
VSTKDVPYFGYDEAIAQTAVSSSAQTPVQNTTTNGTNGGGMLVYQNNTYGIKMQYPSGWQVAQFNNSAAPTKLVAGFLSPVGVQRVTDRIPENILVAVENLTSRNMGLAPYTTLQLSQLAEGTQGFDLVESLPTTIANNPAHQIVYTETLDQLKLKKMQVWTVKDGIAYLIIYAADEADYPSQLPTVKKMLDSFEIINTAQRGANSTR